MKKRTNRQFNQIVAVLLVFVSVCAIVILKHFDNSDNILNNYFEYNSSTQTNQFKTMNSRQQQGFISVSNINLSNYKGVKSSISNVSSNLEVDFPTMSNSEGITHVSIQNNAENRGVNTTKNEASYSIQQRKISRLNASNIQFSSTKTSAYSSRKAGFSNNIGNQLEGSFGGNNQTNANNVSNVFSSNNTLSLTTDLSGNNSPMLLDGTGNPGDPGVPVGDGTWVMLILMLGYSLKKLFKCTL